jgi:GNAT superfamily N-acetyltransferase
MTTLSRTYSGIRIVPLCDKISMEIKINASKALNGDGTCSLTNMHSSCFASETCAHGLTPSMQLDNLQKDMYAFVAVCDIQPDGFRGLTNNSYDFVGCVSASNPSTHMKTLFPQLNDECLVISNLCVAEAYRRFGVGKMLIERVNTFKKDKNCYLFVAKNINKNDPNLSVIFDKRVDRLMKTYSRLSFTPVCECEHAFLLQHVV